MAKQKMHAEEVTVKILVPDGYEAVDFRQPNLYEKYLNYYGKAVCKQSEGETGLHSYWVLKRKELTGGGGLMEQLINLRKTWDDRDINMGEFSEGCRLAVGESSLKEIRATIKEVESLQSELAALKEDNDNLIQLIAKARDLLPEPENFNELAGIVAKPELAMEYIIEQIESTRWIPVEERLPEIGEKWSDDVEVVLCGHIYEASYSVPNHDTISGWIIDCIYDPPADYQNHITHWREITLPKERNET